MGTTIAASSESAVKPTAPPTITELHFFTSEHDPNPYAAIPTLCGQIILPRQLAVRLPIDKSCLACITERDTCSKCTKATTRLTSRLTPRPILVVKSL